MSRVTRLTYGRRPVTHAYLRQGTGGRLGSRNLQVAAHVTRLSERIVVTILLLVLAGWAALSVVLGLVLCRGMRGPTRAPAPPAVQVSVPESLPAADDVPQRSAASA